MHIFYTPQITLGRCVLTEEESSHCVRVLRLEEGAEIQLIDGKGGAFKAVIEHAHPKHCSVLIIGAQDTTPRPLTLHIAIAPTKNLDRIEWFVEKCTEIGITDITPLRCDHSERKQVNLDRLFRVALSAVKQSQQTWIPEIHPLISVNDFVAQCQTEQKFIAHCEDTQKQTLAECYRRGSSASVLIGPEGDFSPDEITLALQHQFVPITLGNTRLRTETAGLVACHSIVFMNV